MRKSAAGTAGLAEVVERGERLLAHSSPASLEDTNLQHCFCTAAGPVAAGEAPVHRWKAGGGNTVPHLLAHPAAVERPQNCAAHIPDPCTSVAGRATVKDAWHACKVDC